MKKEVRYIPYRDKFCDIVTMDMEWFDYREGEDDLPKVGAFCKKCAKNTAKPMMPIYMNGRQAYALHCDKCGSEYPMYKSMFITRYVGYDLEHGGHVNPTYGMKSIPASMDRKAREYYNKREERVAKIMCDAMKCTPEEYKEKQKEWEKYRKKSMRKFEDERVKFHLQFQEEERKEKSAKRKELIDKGIIKYIKNVGLVNTETGEIIKL